MAAESDPLTQARDAVNDMIRSADNCAGFWTTPRAPGKWSPSQVTEHVARALEASASDIRGERSSFPMIPSLLRPVVRMMLMNRVLKNNRFSNARTNAAMDPPNGPENPMAAAKRLDAAWGSFSRAYQDVRPKSATMKSQLFGTVPLDDYVRFAELHVRHHRKQMRRPET